METTFKIPEPTEVVCGYNVLKSEFTPGGKKLLRIWTKNYHKPHVYYSFRTDAELETFLAEWKEKKCAEYRHGLLRKEAEKTFRENFVSPYKVGDILEDSWGYDQTNIDFYQVTEVKSKMVILRRIGAETVKGSYGHDSARVTPKKDSFHGDPIKKIVVIRVREKDKEFYPAYYITSKFGGSLSIYDGGDHGSYMSWGH